MPRSLWLSPTLLQASGNRFWALPRVAAGYSFSLPVTVPHPLVRTSIETCLHPLAICCSRLGCVPLTTRKRGNSGRTGCTAPPHRSFKCGKSRKVGTMRLPKLTIPQPLDGGRSLLPAEWWQGWLAHRAEPVNLPRGNVGTGWTRFRHLGPRNYPPVRCGRR
jgi:hypothetical protein